MLDKDAGDADIPHVSPRSGKAMPDSKRGRIANKECSMARAMEVVGDRWSILILREAFYGVKRFDEFEYYVGIAPNILSNRLKKFVDAGIMTRVPLPEHSTRYEYVLTEQGRDFFPAYLALKKWGDDWLAEPEGPQVVFRERSALREIKYPRLTTSGGKRLRLEDVEVVAGSGAVPFNRKRFGAAAATAPGKLRASRRKRQ
jgi:DNA-binding HxlR family transcriptional regulator